MSKATRIRPANVPPGAYVEETNDALKGPWSRCDRAFDGDWLVRKQFARCVKPGVASVAPPRG